MKSVPGGFFITVEGIDGCGKTTQSAMLAEYLRGQGLEVTHTREPGGTAIGNKIRAILLDPANTAITGMTELMLYSADRAQHMDEVINPLLERGGIVVCDRFTDATAAYQGYARGLQLKLIDTLSAIATDGRKPDMTLVLDLPVEKALTRARQRNCDNNTACEARFEDESLEFHGRVRQGYLSIAAAEPGRVKVIRAEGGIEEIQAALREAVDRKLGERL